MRRPLRYLPALFIGLVATAPLFGCDLLKPKPEAVDGGVVVVATDPNATVTPGATTAVPVPNTPATPLGPAVTPAPAGQPTVKTDAGTVVADSGVKTDGAAPAPVPPFPAFDAGALHGFDAGGLLKGIDAGGFKPPWVK